MSGRSPIGGALKEHHHRHRDVSVASEQPRRQRQLGADFLPSSLVMQDLTLVVKTRRWWPGGLIRAALLTFAASRQDQLTTIHAFRVRSSRLATDLGFPLPDAEVEAEVQRFLSRRPQPIKPEAIARLGGVSSTEAASLGLRIVQPVRRPVEAPNDAARQSR
jgi:hypothetical protein